MGRIWQHMQKREQQKVPALSIEFFGFYLPVVYFADSDTWPKRRSFNSRLPNESCF
jgi:hypothetical protein